MRIRRLDICGFKSFMDRMTFVFGDGITGVVGPNGCGKSNVVDSIRWVMGEQSAKNLRGKSMEDIIFNGSESHAPLSMAEVSLTFDNDGSAVLPATYAGFPEITVTRRLFRSGESEYLINKTPCRLLDITELFLGTGVGTKAYSIIEQGRIGLIVSSKPEDRKVMIEEAAGITKYKARRKAAERKMEYTEQNLLRVGDILGELEKRLDALQRQARKAERYKALKAEMKEIELHLAAVRYLELQAYARQAATQVEAHAAEEQRLAQALTAGEEQLSTTRGQLTGDAEVLRERTEVLLGLENQVKLDESQLEYMARDEAETQARIAEAQADAEALKGQLAAMQSERVEAEQAQADLAELVKADEALLQTQEVAFRDVSYAQSDAARKLETERGSLVEVITRVTQHQNNLSNLAKQRQDLAARLLRLGGEADQLVQSQQDHEARRTALTEQLEGTRQSKTHLDERRIAEEAALSVTRASFAENEAKLIALREELSERRSRLTAMMEIARSYEGFDRGVRAVMLRAGDDLKRAGIEGVVADLLSSSPDHERAIEAALGQRLQAVVVHEQRQGLQAIDFLQKAGEGRSSFISLDVTPQGALAPAALAFDGFVARALDVVKHQPSHVKVVQALLGDVVIVKDLPSALAGQALHHGLTFVTLTGEVLDGRGVLTGGVLEGVGAGALQQKREIQELADVVAATEARFGVSQSEHQALSKKASEIEAALKGLTAQGHEHALQQMSQERDLGRATEDLSRARERLGQLDQEREILLRSEAELAAEEASSQGESVAGEAERSSKQQRVAELAGDLDGLRQQSEQITAELTRIKIKLAGDAEKREGVARTLARLAVGHTEMVEREIKLAQAVSEGEQKLSGLSERVQAARNERELHANEAEAQREALVALREAHQAAQNQLSLDEQALRAQRKALEEASAARGQQSLKEQELRLQLVNLVDQINSRYTLELPMEVQRFHALPVPGPERDAQLQELRVQVERMGAINLTAIDEYAELSKRFEFLTKQRADLEDSLKQLRTAIVKIDLTSQERFRETFDLINEKFQSIFPRLFAGGKASLQLVKDPQTGEQGVEILAQPPGKNLKSVTLLSGGEKALTAVSLIFAIFLIKPTPFCLLDEVDAPLDDANVGRYNEMIREMSSQSQFILITHNKRTMEISDTLYGVTMEEAGVSKLVSVKLSELARARAG
jgi:chromosome segregation protein